MYPMVQQQQQQQQQQPQSQQPPQQHRQSLDNDPPEDTNGIRHHRSRRPLYRRLFNYVREAWTGVKFALGKQHVMGKQCKALCCKRTDPERTS
ncbi:hypothetical protein GEV33_001129 [Tenebrio molitor]|uniref:Uncharacterized protein n=1 Tax=Tenebrio molitor TaxID=7067 RepID=A0A8J6LK83_TENMO|nr:hypothetical protein GEV33_001129 [Tenebrio molitor]